MKILEDRIAIVTGAGRGIGKAVSELFVSEAATVFGVSRTQAELDELAAATAGAGAA